MLFDMPTQTELFNEIIKEGAASLMDDRQFIEAEIRKWLGSPKYKEMVDGEKYYQGFHDILQSKRTAIGENGELVEVKNLPNRHDIDNQYAIAVDKKTNYFLGKPIAIESDNQAYSDALQKVMNKKFMKKMKNLCKKSLNCGIAWMYPHFGDDGKLKITLFPGYEILPEWKDKEHEELDLAIRIYEVLEYQGTTEVMVQKVEVYKPDGIYRFVLQGYSLLPDVVNGEYIPYFSVDNKPFQWNKVPLIAFKYNDEEVPLIRRTKCLQDAINEMISMFHNNMLEDNRNTILIIKNYDGTNLGEFRRNLSTYGAVKVRSIEGKDGGVDALQIEVNAGNYSIIMELLKMALIENARSFDGKLLKSGTPNQMNILSVYNEIDIDTNEMETEYQAALEELLPFINAYLSLSGMGDFTGEEVTFTFNRDMLINESEILGTLSNLGVKISQKTLLKQVPWIDDVDAELEEVKAEQEEAMDIYGNAFTQPSNFSDQTGNGEDE